MLWSSTTVPSVGSCENFCGLKLFLINFKMENFTAYLQSWEAKNEHVLQDEFCVLRQTFVGGCNKQESILSFETRKNDSTKNWFPQLTFQSHTANLELFQMQQGSHSLKDFDVFTVCPLTKKKQGVFLQSSQFPSFKIVNEKEKN